MRAGSRDARGAGVERRGAPVTAFTRIDDAPIQVRTSITTPDIVVVLDAANPERNLFLATQILDTGRPCVVALNQADLASDLVARGWEVTVETHGQLPMDRLPPAVVRIADVKTPGSGEVARDLTWLDGLRPADEVKFVVTSEEDFRWSLDVVRRHRLEGRVAVLFSPVHGRVAPRDLARWMLESGVGGRLNLQLHKIVWGPDRRGV